MAAKETSGCVVVGAILAGLCALLAVLVGLRSCVDDRPALTAADMPAAPEPPSPAPPRGVALVGVAYIWHASGKPYPVFPVRSDLEAFTVADADGKNLLALRAHIVPNGTRVTVLERSGGIAKVRAEPAGVEGYVYAPALVASVPERP